MNRINLILLKGDNMKILHFAEYAKGGVATYLRNTISFQLESDDIDQVVLINSKNKSEEFTFINESKFKQFKYKYSRGISGIFKLLSQRKVIDAYEPDIVHIHSSFAGLIRLLFFFKKPSYKVVYCAHGWSFIQENKSKLEKKVYAIIERVLALKTNLIINVSKNEYLVAIEHKLPKNKMKIVYNSIPNSLTLSSNDMSSVTLKKSSPQNKVLLFVGRFDKAKGLNFLIDSLDFKDKGIDLFIIGESVLGDTKNQDTKENIHFLGWIDNGKLSAYMIKADAVIVPSLWEGFGLVALEAMKNRKIVISSNAGGLPELIEDGFNGLVFKKGSVSDLERAVTIFNSMSESQISEMGENGFSKYSQKYNYSKLNGQLVQYYKNL
ncbi:glycosyltransferase [Pediococcus argentinicus]|uniref:Glycosyltransferase n=2 Tax=Pediococcus argentinicus TaxID=480391 RepID=A0A0R2N804_9LACO|nr:glycosyltransferase [Pediococcus argentinicus]